MAYNPLPDTALISLNGVRFKIKYADSFVAMDDPDIEDFHIHNSYEIYINVSGNVSFLVENRHYPIKCGDVVITRPGEMHHCIYHSSCIHEHFCIWCEAPESSFLHPILSEPEFCNLRSPDSHVRKKLLVLSYRLNDFRCQGNLEIDRTTCFLQLISLLDDRLDPASKSPATMPGELQQILDYINQHFCEIQHLKEIYDLFFISPSTVNRLFRKYIHLSPHKFLETRKLALAQQLLIRGMTVSQACLQCGFSDCSHFISIFKKKFGETPYKYKINRKIDIT